MRAQRRCSVGSIVALLAWTASGCYSHTTVKPEQLPRLNDSFAVGTGSNIVAVRVATVERPNGTLTEVAGKFDLAIRLRNGKELEFDHPVRAAVSGGNLTLQGANRGPTVLALAEISRAEVVQLDSVGTALEIIGISLGAFAVYFLVIVAAQ
jgi:hypothetical protein